MTLQALILLLIIGLAAGMLSGLVGVGGGIILVPAMYYIFHETQFQAQGTSLGVLTVPVTLVAFVQYYEECKKVGTPIDLKVVALLAAGFVIGSYFGSNIAIRIDKDLLKKIFAVVLLYTGIKMLNLDVAFIKWVRNIF